MINTTILQGNLTRDPELKQVGEHTICNFTVAWSEKRGERENRCFLRCTAWNHTANFVNNYFAKGQEIIVIGQLRTEEWENNGQTHSMNVLNVNECHFCGPKVERTQTEQQPNQTPSKQKPQPEVAQTGFIVGDFDDFFEASDEDEDDDFPY